MKHQEATTYQGYSRTLWQNQGSDFDFLRAYSVRKHPWPLESYDIKKLFYVMEKGKQRLCLYSTPDPGLVSYSNEMAK